MNATTSETKSAPTLDVSGQYAWTIVQDGDGWSLELDLDHTTPGSQLTPRLYQGLIAKADSQNNPLLLRDSLEEVLAGTHKKLRYALPEPLPKHLSFIMNNQPVSELDIEGNTSHRPQVVPTRNHAIYQLAISETRALGMALDSETIKLLPYDRAPRKGFDPAVHAPMTDLHTHSSAQIRSEDLFDIAVEADRKAKEKGGERVCYPLGLLELLGVAPANGHEDARIIEMTAREFSPLQSEDKIWEKKGAKCSGIPISELDDVQRKAIIRKMSIAVDTTLSFSKMDPQLYRFRNPLVKHPDLARGMIRKIAEDYAAMGIEYAELSTGAMLDPEWFKAMAEEVADIDAHGVGPDHKKVTLRFLIGLPRTFSAQRCAVWLTQVKHLLRHPYMVGVDLLGYESNKTTDFHWVLSHLLQWATASENTDLRQDEGWNFIDWITYRVHAGETVANLDNVGDTVDIADAHAGGRIRIGHAANYKLSLTQKSKIQHLTSDPESDRFITERCMDANQVYRSQKLVHNQKPFVAAPKVLGSDGGGAFGSTPVGLAYSALAGGWTLKDLETNRKWEQGYVNRQRTRDGLKQQAFERHYGAGSQGLDAFLNEYRGVLKAIPQGNKLPKEFEGKQPFLIAGPGGSSWDLLDRMDKETATRAAEFLVRVLDPKSIYFVLGRMKSEGITRALDKVILRYNHDNPTNKFLVLARYHGADAGPTGELAESIRWVHAIPGDLDAVPSDMVQFTKAEGGKAIVFPGSDFSGEMVGLSEDSNVPCAMHVPKTKGHHFQELAHTATTESKFSDFDSFVRNVFDGNGPAHLFHSREERQHFIRPGIDLQHVAEEVKALRLESKEPRHRINNNRHYGDYLHN